MDDVVSGTASARIHEAECARDRGRIGDARGRFAAALDDARATGDPELFARAALGLGGVWVHEHRDAVDRAHALAMQRFAVAQLEPHDPLAVRLSTRLAAEESYITGNPTAIRDALARARECADPIARAEAVSLAHHCLLGPDHHGERLALAREAIECSAATGRSLDASLGLCWRTIDLFLGGDPRAERALEELRARDLEDCVQFTVLAMGVMQAIRAGELSRAENLARECYEYGLEVGDADALGCFGVQLVLLRWLQGRGAELLPFLSDLRGSPTLIEVNDGFDAAIAVLAATDGQLDEAKGALQRLLTRDRSLTRNSSTWLAILHGIVEAPYALEDAQTARIAYDLLAPYADRPVMVSFAVACFGSAHRTLGAAAATFGNLDLAVAHLEAAVATDLALGNRPCHALSCALLADVLERRGRPADRARLGRKRVG